MRRATRLRLPWMKYMTFAKTPTTALTAFAMGKLSTTAWMRDILSIVVPSVCHSKGYTYWGSGYPRLAPGEALYHWKLYVGDRYQGSSVIPRRRGIELDSPGMGAVA